MDLLKVSFILNLFAVLGRMVGVRISRFTGAEEYICLDLRHFGPALLVLE